MLYGAQTPRRRDAQRNRSAILQAATELMGGTGPAVPVPEIARRAGVAQATLYRHFPDRDALTAAVIGHHLQRLEDYVAAHADRPVMFRQLLRAALHTQIELRPLTSQVRRPGRADTERHRRRLVAALTGPLRQAQRDGYVRPDLAPADLPLLLDMVQAAGDPGRCVELVLDGVCPLTPGSETT